MRKSVCVIGGGASGMAAAIAAAKAGALVTLLEKNPRMGKKILLTGNGKCNLTNLDMDISAYGVSDRNCLVGKILDQFDEKSLMAFFSSIGMRFTVNKGTYVYPESEAAETVLQVLERALKKYDVHCCDETKVTHIQKTAKGFLIETDKEDHIADRVILSCGGCSYPKTGSDGAGFKLAEDLGIEVLSPYPALTAFVCPTKEQKLIAGLRSHAKVSLYIEDKLSMEDTGQVQFTDYGISGIPVFQVSTLGAKALVLYGQEVTVKIDLFPEQTKEEVKMELAKQLERFHSLSLTEALVGFLHKKWIHFLDKRLGFSSWGRAGTISEKQQEMLVEELMGLTFLVKDVKGFDFCQVTGGGVATHQIDENLMVKAVPGLYITGEMLDVTGKCGGYNLQWAFSTGCLAGAHSAR
ncbi:MAG: aminoacetone oxidase family FAD-binding enzyme [Lachnospiraceae bacterium]|nr:aminoacetone oxidase family FAD-binding enzyme [Lachnospiraceae bacterium]